MTDLPRSRSEISRREFLAAAGFGTLGLAGMTVLRNAPPGSGRALATARSQTSAPGTVTHPIPGAAARVLPFDNGWLFGGLYSPGSRQPGFDDVGFTEVVLPHCVTPLSWREWNYGTWEKVWIYRRHFDLPPSFAHMRVFVDFTGALTSALPAINGRDLPEHQGGYLPFTYELTDYLAPKDNVLAVELNCTWQNVPPEGAPGGPASIDFLETGGLYREVWLRAVPQIFIADVFAKPVDVLTSTPQVQVQCTVDAAVVPTGPVRLQATLYDGAKPIGQVTEPVTIATTGEMTATLTLRDFGAVELWSPESPRLYEVVATLYVEDQPVHDFSRRIGFRQAVFQVDGFFLNGKRYKIFGLDRHQIFPYTGQAMPPRVQYHDAEILKKELNCNMVRCSHCPQSPYFLDACDELGIMVWEETPGWGYLGNAAWQAIMLQNVHDMVVRDRSRPAVVIWGVSPNEAPRDPSLYATSQDIANSLDGTRQTSGTQTQHNLTNWNLEVFAMDDYGSSNGNATLLPPIPGVPYLVTEAVGAIDGARAYQWTSSQVVQQEQARMHAQVHNIAGSENGYSGLLAWCAYDYDSDQAISWNLKQPGVADTFRVLKPGAAFYRAQVDASVRPVIEPSFYWYFGSESPVTALGDHAMIWSNCDRIEAYLDGKPFATLTPAAARTSPGLLQGYPYLLAPPFYLDVSGVDAASLPELRLDGYVGSRLALSRSFSADTTGDHLQVTVDDADLVADGADATRVAFRAVDRFGAPRPYVGGQVTIEVNGPGSYVGRVAAFGVTATPAIVAPGGTTQVTATFANGTFAFGQNGGVGGVWVRTVPDQPGIITVKVSHPTLGTEQAQIRSSKSAEPMAEGAPNADNQTVATGQPAVAGLLAAAPLPSGTKKRTASARSLATVEGLALSLPATEGWTAVATSPTSFASVPPGRTVAATWTLTAPSTPPTAAGPVPAVDATFSIDGAPGSDQVPVPVAVAVSLAAAFDNIGISDDNDVASIEKANFDGAGNSFSQQLLTAAGLAPGATVVIDGVHFIWPNVAATEPDNVLANGQAILFSGSGTKLGFIGASSPSDAGGTVTVHYSDGSTSSAPITLDNYFYPVVPETGDTVVLEMPYINDSNPAFVKPPGRRDHPGWLFFTSVPLTAGKTVQAVVLPSGGRVVGGRIEGAHIFTIGIG